MITILVIIFTIKMSIPNPAVRWSNGPMVKPAPIPVCYPVCEDSFNATNEMLSTIESSLANDQHTNQNVSTAE